MPVSTQHKDYDRMLPKWKRCRDVADGQDAVHAATTTYLPKLNGQAPKDYESYVKRATFYNATWRTISGLVGMMLRQPPIIEAPASVIELLKDVDMAGTPLQVFAQDVCEQALTVGRLGILVDCPPITGPTATLADAQAQNIRPTLQVYRAEDVLNWKTGRINNRTVLMQVTLKEIELVAKDEYESVEEDRWRVLDLRQRAAKVGDNTPSKPVYRQRLFKMKGGQANVKTLAFEQIGEDIFPRMNGQPMTFIPFQFLGSDDVTSDVDEPPLIDLVDLNLAHYRVSADYEHGCHFTGLPTLFLAGFKKEMDDAGNAKEVYIGSESAIVSSNPDASASYVEVNHDFEPLLKNLAAKEQQMAVLGARMLEPQKKAPEAADSGSIRRKGEESMLSSVAQAISLGLTITLRWFTAFAGQAADGVKFELNRDFYPMRMDGATLSSLVSAWQQGAISDQTLFENLQQGEIIAQDTTLEDEQARIAAKQADLLAQQAAYNTGQGVEV